jgi:hypothetical protein
MQAMASSQPTSTQSEREPKTKRLFPAYVWYLTALFLYKTRNFHFMKKRSRAYDIDDKSFFRKSGLDSSLEYGHAGLEFEDPNEDFLSANSYGSVARWSPEMNKFDLELELEMTDSQI